MRPPEEVKREFVEQWLSKALSDLEAAQHLLEAGERLSYSATFHAQQAAEKLLKGILVWSQVAFPKTHDIGRLVELLAEVEPSLAGQAREAVALTPFGVEFRYPGDQPEPTVSEAREAVAIAERLRDAVLSHLPDDFKT